MPPDVAKVERVVAELGLAGPRRVPPRQRRREDGGAAGRARTTDVELRDYFLKGAAAARRASGRWRRRASTSAATSRRSSSTTSSSASARRAPARPTWRWRRPSRFLLAKKVSRIILARPAVEAGEKLGFLPGDLQEKVNPYLRPLYDALYDMLDAERVERLLERGTIEIAPIAFMRGPHAERLVRHPRRGAEHDLRADEDVPDAPRASGRRRSSPATSRRSTCRRAAPPASIEAMKVVAQHRGHLRSSTSTSATSCGTSWCSRSSRPTRRSRTATASRGASS